MTRASFRTLRWIFVFCCMGTGLADWLFYDQPAGANLAVFHAVLLLLAVVQRVAPVRIVRGWP